MSCLSHIFYGISNAKEPIEKSKNQQGDPFQVESSLRLWVSQSLNLQIYRGVMAMRIVLGLLQPDLFRALIWNN
jgi:hypothetical protein